MSEQNLFASILEKKMKSPVKPITHSEVHSVDEVISPEFNRVFGHGSLTQRGRGLQAYGVA
jgi:hypothetical protein